MRRRSPPGIIITMLLPMLTACADRLVAPAAPQPDVRIAELLSRAPQMGALAIAHTIENGRSEYYVARGRMLGGNNDAMNASFRMDFPEADLSFRLNPAGGRYMLNVSPSMQITWSFFCYDFGTNTFIQLNQVRINNAKQEAIPNTGGHLGLHSLPAKPVASWAPANSAGAFVRTWTSTVTAGIASGDERVLLPSTVQDPDSDCRGEVQFEASSATRYTGLNLLTGLRLAPITSNHASVYYATSQMQQHAVAANQFYRASTPDSVNFTVTAAALIYGGINDVVNNWRAPHTTHRVGTDLDIDGSSDTPRVWNRLIAAGRRGGFALCEVHNQNHVHCYDTRY